MNSQSKPSQKKLKCPSSAHHKKIGLSKTNAIYWRDRLNKTTSANGKTNADYSVRINFKKKRVRFPLHTANKNEAASKTATIFKFLIEEGWDATLKKFKPEAIISTREKTTTIGSFIETARKFSSVRSNTFLAYEQALRKITSDIFGYSAMNNGHNLALWKESTNMIPLSELTPQKIQKWKRQRIEETTNESTRRKAMVTTNSQICNAKALFSKKNLHFIKAEIELPDILPFEGIRKEKVGSLRYHSQIDTKKIMKKAKLELKNQTPETYKIFLLAFICGLRVSEIDHLLWEVIDLEQKTLHVKNTKHHTLKSDDSEGLLDLNNSVVNYLKECHSLSENEFVVTVTHEDNAPKSARYRCQRHLNHLKDWLRNNGVHEQKPIHTLRKEIGSIIASEQGIYAASRYLRHADIQITASFYLDKKQKICPPINV